jgi:hypothetical protein
MHSFLQQDSNYAAEWEGRNMQHTNSMADGCHEVQKTAGDEMPFSLDGSTVTRGGCPAVMYQDHHLSQLGKMTSKSSQTTTMILVAMLGEKLFCHIFTS